MTNNKQTVFTVRDVLQKGALIQYVVHDNNGDWQFFPGYEVPSTDMMVVTLSNIIEYDKSIVDILNLERGYQAYRRNKADEWLISEL